MCALPLPAAIRFAAVSVAICLGPALAAAQRAPADPHAHPHGPHQTLPPYPPGRSAVTVNPVPPPVPAAPPPAPVLPAPIVVPTRRAEPPPPPTVSEAAAGAVTQTPDGLRVTFGNGSSDLNPETESALEALAKSVHPPAEGTFTVAAYAAGTPDDPSTARRLSLARALAVRSVLIHSGVPSPRIYVRALGASVPPPDGVSPDRVDVTITVAPAPAPPPSPGQSAPPQKAAP
jgi:outer membrane protein OmpA-like peptidoglycan-associated protein